MGKKKDKKKNKMTELDTLFDIDDILQSDNARVSTVARQIRERIERGATEDDISWYKADTLKATLSFFRIAGRSKLTYKEDMAKKLIEVFGSDTKEKKHGKASLPTKDKLKERAELDKLILRNISKRGGI